MKFYTGLPTKQAFQNILLFLSSKLKNIRYWRSRKVISTKRQFRSAPARFGPKRVLTSQDEFLLTLMKLRLGKDH